MLCKTAFFIQNTLTETEKFSLCAQNLLNPGFIPLLHEAAGAANPAL